MLPQGISSTRNSMLLKRKDFDLYKTQDCTYFKRSGRCNYGDNCIFIHASQDATGIPLTVQGKENFSDAKRLKCQNMVGGYACAPRLCKIFSSGKECPYGVKCLFLHDWLGRTYGGDGTISRSYPINIGTSDSGHHSACLRQSDWKTKLCHKWSTMNYCPYGDRCTYAHGQAELRDISSSQRVRDPTLKMVITTRSPLLTSGKVAVESTMHQQLPRFDWEQGKKIVGVYADWIDDPLIIF